MNNKEEKCNLRNKESMHMRDKENLKIKVKVDSCTSLMEGNQYKLEKMVRFWGRCPRQIKLRENLMQSSSEENVIHLMKEGIKNYIHICLYLHEEILEYTLYIYIITNGGGNKE